MEELKQSFQDFLNGEKSSFILVVSRLILLILFFISLYIPFIFEVTIIGGKMSLSQLPGGIWFVLIVLFTIPAYFYLHLIKKEKAAKKVLLLHAIFASLIFTYGVLVYRVGFPSTATAGFGKHLGFILLVFIWFTFIKEALTLSLIRKYILKDNNLYIEVEENE